ncbi:MAG: hypothetical protein ACXAC7_08210 [Candidatus Hodarchaeales archaeon]|jgi:hypothetical protein
MTDFEDIFGKYWLSQIILFFILFSYSFLLTTGITLMVSNPENFFPHLGQNSNDENNEYSIVLIFESKVNTKPITWDPVIIKRNYTTTLFNVMNSTLTISGKTFGSFGYFVEEINGLKQDNSNFWRYEYFNIDNEWSESPVGISSFQINTNSYFRWIYKPR